MHCLATFRIVIAAAALAISLPAYADAKLDAMIEDHVMPRFDRQARLFIKNAGARFVSSHWNSHTRTLMASGEMQRRRSAAPVDVAHDTDANLQVVELKTDHVATLCRHPNATLIRRFLEKYDVSIALVYDPGRTRVGPLVVEISHSDLGSCA